MKKYQQGDVVLISVTKAELLNEVSKNNAIANPKTKEPNRHELAYGEETGHCHAIYFDELLDKAGVTVYKSQSSWRRTEVDGAVGVIVECDDAVIKHEEHNPVALPKGYYIQRIVKEYDPLSGLVRNVVD
tara:strand:+ start:155 stop:544 length:390 start_codon:yes stop_codon:yes gene_type:complete